MAAGNRLSSALPFVLQADHRDQRPSLRRGPSLRWWAFVCGLVCTVSLAACATPPAEHPEGEAALGAGAPAPGDNEPAVVEPLSLPAQSGGPTVVGSAPGAARQGAGEDAASLLQSEPEPSSDPAAGEAAGGIRVLPGGVGVEDIVVGNGPEVQPGMKLSVHYVGRLQDGTEFDSSRKRNRPFVYEFGAGRVIKGWEEGVAGMRVGGVRRLLIPPHKGYGSRNTASIPANSILDFEIELLSVQ